MDTSTTVLRECRKLLRDIQCEAVVDTSDQNLYDILIGSEEKKTVLLTWLVQNLFSPDQCHRSTFEDLLSMFMTNAELNSFLRGTMSVKNQHKKWILLMSTVKQRKEQTGTDCQHTVDRIFNGTLLDELTDSWNQKVLKPSVSLYPGVSNSKRIADLRDKVEIAKEELKDLDTLSKSISEVHAESTGDEVELHDIVPRFLNEYPTLRDAVEERILSSFSTRGTSDSQCFVDVLQNDPILTRIQRNLFQLNIIMNANGRKSSLG